MVRILFNEELHFLKKRMAVKTKKYKLIRRIVKKCLDKQPNEEYNIYIMKIEKKKKKRVFQVFFKNPEGKSKYEIVFATSRTKALEGITRIITKIKELYV